LLGQRWWRCTGEDAVLFLLLLLCRRIRRRREIEVQFWFSGYWLFEAHSTNSVTGAGMQFIIQVGASTSSTTEIPSLWIS